MSTQEEREPIAQIEERLRRLKVPETVIAKHVEQLERLRQRKPPVEAVLRT
jgi:hypothetical protein